MFRLHGTTLTTVRDYWKNHSFDYMTFVGKAMRLLYNMLCRLVIAFSTRWKYPSPYHKYQNFSPQSLFSGIMQPLIPGVWQAHSVISMAPTSRQARCSFHRGRALCKRSLSAPLPLSARVWGGEGFAWLAYAHGVKRLVEPDHHLY